MNKGLNSIQTNTVRQTIQHCTANRVLEARLRSTQMKKRSQSSSQLMMNKTLTTITTTHYTSVWSQNVVSDKNAATTTTRKDPTLKVSSVTRTSCVSHTPDPIYKNLKKSSLILTTNPSSPHRKILGPTYSWSGSETHNDVKGRTLYATTNVKYGNKTDLRFLSH